MQGAQIGHSVERTTEVARHPATSFPFGLPGSLSSQGRTLPFGKQSGRLSPSEPWLAEEMAPPGYPFLRLNVEDMMAALRRMMLEQN